MTRDYTTHYDGFRYTTVNIQSPDYKENIPLPFNFRMFDDDNCLYYEGWSSKENFWPLDDYGAPNAGCTSISYLGPDKKWAIL